MTKTITKRKTLKSTLSEMQINESVIIKPAAHSIVYVRHLVKELRDMGYQYEATEKGITEGIKVTRLK